MRMTVDKAIWGLLGIQEYYNDDTGDIYLGFDKADNESVNFAIDTMRKYQKIEQIVANNDNDGMIGRLVREVLEDGK